jgi:hypothetical protein
MMMDKSYAKEKISGIVYWFKQFFIAFLVLIIILFAGVPILFLRFPFWLFDNKKYVEGRLMKLMDNMVNKLFGIMN